MVPGAARGCQRERLVLCDDWHPGSPLEPAAVQPNEPPATRLRGLRVQPTRSRVIFAPPQIAIPVAIAPRRSASRTRRWPSVIPAGWPVDAVAATDVFAAADPRVKRVVAILYGGQRPLVARGWIAREDQLESVTLISPRPDPSLTRLHRAHCSSASSPTAESVGGAAGAGAIIGDA